MARTAHLMTFQSRYSATALTGPVYGVGQSDTATFAALPSVPSGSDEFDIIMTTAAASVVDVPSGNTQLTEANLEGFTGALSWKKDVSGDLAAATDALGALYPWMTLRASVNSNYPPNDQIAIGSVAQVGDTDGLFAEYSYDVASYVRDYTRLSMFAVLVYDTETLGIPVVSLDVNESSFFSLLGSTGYNFGTKAMAIYLYGGIYGFEGPGAAKIYKFQARYTGTDYSKAAGSNVLVFGGGHTVA